MMTNTKLLNELIVKSGLSRVFIAEKLGITIQSLRLKINNENEFKASEIKVLCELLHITPGRIPLYFFNK